MTCTPETLAGAAAKVLEEAAFMFAEPVPVPAPAAPELSAQLTLGAPLGGWVRIESPRAFAAVVAANLLGCDVGDPEAEAKASDGLGELLNIVAGVLTHELLQGQPCRLGAPTIGQARPAGDGVVQVVMRTEDEHLVVLSARLGPGA